MAKPVITADHLYALLQKRHEADVFVGECHNGPVWGSDLLRLDAWVLAKSWSPWRTIGYEIKVTRSDFERDQKWPGYLPYCHAFYFVCPPGLIRAVDLPEGIGLLWCSTGGTKLHIKVKARMRDPDLGKLAKLMSYVLMRHRDAQPPPPEGLARLVQIHAEVEKASARRELAYLVRGHIRERVEAAEVALIEARNLHVQVEQFTERLAALGIVWDSAENNWKERYRVQNEIDALVPIIDEITLRNLEQAAQVITKAVTIVKDLREKRSIAREG